jgi:hypothetical protein
MMLEENAYHELCAYTLAHGDPAFIHQHVVDTFAAQHADAATKPIAITFALVGLYLHVECGWSGRQVQRAHMRLARHKQTWPAFALPGERGSMTAADVLAAPAGPARDRAIDAWCASVWSAYSAAQPVIEDLLRQEGVV